MFITEWSLKAYSGQGGQMKNCGKYFPTFLELDSYQTIKPGCEVINSNDQLVVHLWKPVSTSVTVLFCSQSNSRAQSQLRLRKKSVVLQLLSLHTNLLIVFGNSNTGWPWKQPLSCLSVQVWGHVHREAAKLQILVPFFLPGSSLGLWLEAHRVKMKHFWEEGLSQALPKVHKLLKITVRFIVSIWKPSVTGGIMVYSSHWIVCFSGYLHTLICASAWKYMIRILTNQSMPWKQPPVIVHNGKLCLAVRVRTAPGCLTHTSAALETLQENFIGSFMQLYKAQLVKQTRALWKLSGSEVPRRLRDALWAFKNCTKWHKRDTSDQSSKCIWMTIVCYLSLRDITDWLIISKPDKNIKQVQKYAHISQLYLKVTFMQFWSLQLLK